MKNNVLQIYLFNVFTRGIKCNTSVSIIIVFHTSALSHREYDGGRLDGIKNGKGKRCDDRTSADRSDDRRQWICSDGAGVRRSRCSSVFRFAVDKTLDESHGSGQTVAVADLLFLRHRSEPAIRIDIHHSSHHHLLGRCYLHVGGRFSWTYDPSLLRSVGELQRSYSHFDFMPEFYLHTEQQCGETSAAHQVSAKVNQ